jgi:hypothetical protein
MPPLPAAAYRLAALALCAAVLFVEHLRLAWQARARENGARRLALALAVPGAPAVLAWRDGRRGSAAVYALLALGYLVLLLWR